MWAALAEVKTKPAVRKKQQHLSRKAVICFPQLFWFLFFSPGHLSTCLRGGPETELKANNDSCVWPYKDAECSSQPGVHRLSSLSGWTRLTSTCVFTPRIINRTQGKQLACLHRLSGTSQRCSIQLLSPSLCKQPSILTILLWVFIHDHFSYFVLFFVFFHFIDRAHKGQTK